MRWKILALTPLLVWTLVLPARAAVDQGEILAAQEEALGVDELERAAGESGGEIDYGTSLEEGLGQILDTGSQEIGSIVRRAVRSGVLILLILLLCGLADSLWTGLNQDRKSVV